MTTEPLVRIDYVERKWQEWDLLDIWVQESVHLGGSILAARCSLEGLGTAVDPVDVDCPTEYETDDDEVSHFISLW
jgi:hypothetical protein